MKVFKMNDYDWVAANSLEEAKEWYIAEFGTDESDVEDAVEISLDEGVYARYEGDDYNEIYKQVEPYNKPIEIKGKKFVLRDGVEYLTTFKEVLEKDNLDIPYVVASTEW